MSTLVWHTWLQAGRGMRRSLRMPPVVIQTVLFPILLLLVLAAVFGDLVSEATGRDYAVAMVPLMVLTGAMFGGVGTGAGLVQERMDGLLDRFRAMPTHRASLLAGRVVAEVGRVLVATVVLVAVGYPLGFRFQAGVLAAAGFLLVVAGMAVAFTWVILAVAIRAGSPEQVITLSPAFLLLMFLNSGFVPVTAYPDLVQPLVRVNPLSSAVEALVGLSYGGPVLVAVLQTAAWVAGLSAVLGFLAIRGYRRR